jgi:hypothetical protein
MLVAFAVLPNGQFGDFREATEYACIDNLMVRKGYILSVPYAMPMLSG